jgi:hypothetical protein
MPTCRECKLLCRDKLYVVSRLGAGLGLGLLTGTIFWKIPLLSLFTRYGAM